MRDASSTLPAGRRSQERRGLKHGADIIERDGDRRRSQERRGLKPTRRSSKRMLYLSPLARAAWIETALLRESLRVGLVAARKSGVD